MMMKGPGVIFLALATELVALVIGLVYIGSLLDKKFLTKGFGVAGGAILALIIWTLHLIRVNKTMDNEIDKQ